MISMISKVPKKRYLEDCLKNSFKSAECFLWFPRNLCSCRLLETYNAVMFISLPTQLWKMVNKNLVPSSQNATRIAWGQIIWCTPTVLAYSALSNHLFLVLLINFCGDVATACYSHISCGTFLGPKSHRKPDATRFTSTGSPFIAGTDCPTRFVSPAFFLHSHWVAVPYPIVQLGEQIKEW